MATLWFMIVAVMVAAYVVLDGFDLGAGVIYLGAARTPDERRSIMRAIGPVWDGNEVWLLAAGGTLYFAFPLLYASSFSGFYLPLMMVLWLLMLRGIGIELRAHMQNPVWLGFFDVVFCVSSVLLTIFFGAALGNVVRGVPLGADHYFFEPLWTNFRVGTNNGILDWYTVLTGVIALVTLTAHGSLYVAVKTEGDLNRRARRVAQRAWPLQLLLTVVGLIATVSIRPGVLDNYKHHAIGFLIPVLVFGALAVMMHGMLKRADKMAFVASALYIVGMLVGAAFALYPVVLPSSSDPALNL
ncbi:MAG: cytochrome d ubiquinol oxidase subunit II, partial [Candidatus Sulfotelmatobacter sp.]